jgi:ABC-type glutathione transport system ATPase component
MATHDLRLAERSADYLVFLENGRIVEQGEPQPMLNRPSSKALQSFLQQPPRVGSIHDR